MRTENVTPGAAMEQAVKAGGSSTQIWRSSGRGAKFIGLAGFMEIQLRSLNSGRKVKSFGKLTSGHPAALVFWNGKVLHVRGWASRKARVLHATKLERAALVAWLLRNLPPGHCY